MGRLIIDGLSSTEWTTGKAMILQECFILFQSKDSKWEQLLTGIFSSVPTGSLQINMALTPLLMFFLGFCIGTHAFFNLIFRHSRLFLYYFRQVLHGRLIWMDSAPLAVHVVYMIYSYEL